MPPMTAMGTLLAVASGCYRVAKIRWQLPGVEFGKSNG